MPLTIKQYLKNRFPQLGTNKEMNGADTVDALGDLYAEADSRRSVVTRPIMLDKNVNLYNNDETYTEAGKAYARAVGGAVFDAYVAAARVGPNRSPRTTIVDANHISPARRLCSGWKRGRIGAYSAVRAEPRFR